MWTLYESPQVQKILRKCPIDILKRYEKWKDIIYISGPQGLRLIKGFHDEKLKGKWQSYRSSRLGIQYRVIYIVERDIVTVVVLEITPHDY